jgi:hypothetical protein
MEYQGSIALPPDKEKVLVKTNMGYCSAKFSKRNGKFITNKKQEILASECVWRPFVPMLLRILGF